ncbi:hypothetical protein O0L34_g4618 [Tuta absoluta]|nr:hypothetical protein O0L34_g4618 [Tuta absoluta]
MGHDTTKSQYPNTHKPFEFPGQRRMGGARKSNRTSNVIIRIVDKNFNVVKAIQYFSNSTRSRNTTSTVVTTTHKILTNVESDAAPHKTVPRIILLKLLPNNTFVLEEEHDGQETEEI